MPNLHMKPIAVIVLMVAFINASASLADNVVKRLMIRKLSMSRECLQDIESVRRIGSLVDKGITPESNCKTVTDSNGTRSTCDATGSADANQIIKACSDAGGKDVSILYTLDCTLNGGVKNTEEMIGPLCFPQRCSEEDYFEHRNSISVPMNFVNGGGCVHTFSSTTQDTGRGIALAPLAISVIGTFTVISILLVYLQKRNERLAENHALVLQEFS